MEDNEEPDEDEEDPDVEDEQETEKPAEEAKPVGSIFSGSSETSSPAPSSIFGGSANSSSQNLFGGSGASQPGFVFGGGAVSSTSSKSIFGGANSSTPSASIFGGSAATTSASMFGGAAAVTATTTSTVFGGAATNTSTVFGGASSSSSLFSGSSTSTSSLFGNSNPTPAGTLFGKPVTSSLALSTSSSAVPDTPVFKGTGFSFASLAADSTAKPVGFGGSDSFQFSGAGSKLFSGGEAAANRSGAADDDENDEDDDGHDPHFEPIVPLPELVETKTGEEEEEIIFKHRAKVYRYDTDNKEWKERGVGDIKILKHPERKTYRVLLRRDQVYKIACNHLITKEMQLNPLASSETAWCWFAMDYSEGNPKGAVDQLAVRFKTKETALDFKEKFEGCQERLGEEGQNQQKSIDTSSTWKTNELTQVILLFLLMLPFARFTFSISS